MITNMKNHLLIILNLLIINAVCQDTISAGFGNLVPSPSSTIQGSGLGASSSASQGSALGPDATVYVAGSGNIAPIQSVTTVGWAGFGEINEQAPVVTSAPRRPFRPNQPSDNSGIGSGGPNSRSPVEIVPEINQGERPLSNGRGFQQGEKSFEGTPVKTGFKYGGPGKAIIKSTTRKPALKQGGSGPAITRAPPPENYVDYYGDDLPAKASTVASAKGICPITQPPTPSNNFILPFDSPQFTPSPEDQERTIAMLILMKEIQPTKWDFSAYAQKAAAGIVYGGELDCGGERPCCWQNAQPNTDQLEFALGTADFPPYEFGLAFETNSGPSGNFMFLASAYRENDQYDAKFISCPIVCTDRPVNVSLRHWRTEGVVLEVCVRTAMFDHPHFVPMLSCVSIPASQAPGPSLVQLPPGEAFEIVITAYNLTGDSANLVIIDDIRVDYISCDDDPFYLKTSTTTTTTTTRPPTTARNPCSPNPCDDRCTNNRGQAQCSCTAPNTVLAPNRRRCDKIVRDPCANNRCEGECFEDGNDGYECLCIESGTELAPDGFACQQKGGDACASNPCGDLCLDLSDGRGSFECICFSSEQQIAADGRTCEDIPFVNADPDYFTRYENCLVAQCTFEPGNKAQGDQCGFENIDQTIATDARGRLGPLTNSVLRAEAFELTTGRFGNRLTGVRNAGVGNGYLAAYLYPKESAAVFVPVLLTEDTVLRFKWFKATNGMIMRLCCNDGLHADQCPFESDAAATASDLQWQTLSVTCPQGTDTITWVCINRSANQGACAIDHVQLISADSEENEICNEFFVDGQFVKANDGAVDIRKTLLKQR